MSTLSRIASTRVFTCLQICCSLIHTAAAGRIQRGSCSPNIACDKMKHYLEVEQDKGNCRPMAPRHIMCEAGVEPAKNAWRFDLPDFSKEPEGQRCRPRYGPRQCKYVNEHYAKDGKPKFITTDNKPCRDPHLSIGDCEALMTTLAAHDAAKKTGQGVLEDLTRSISELETKGPDEYYWLPGFRNAIWKLSSAVIEVLAEETSNTRTTSLVEPVKVLLEYCKGAKARAKKINDELEYDKLSDDEVDENGFEECKSVTQMDIIFGSNPWKKDLETDIDTITRLHHFERMNIQYLEKEAWEELLNFAPPADKDQMMVAYEKLQKKFGELIVNAGDRGETELQLAIAFSSLIFSGGAKPEGGEARLKFMRAYREFKNLLQSARCTADKIREAKQDIEAKGIEAGKAGVPQPGDFEEVMNAAAQRIDELESGAPLTTTSFMHPTTTTTSTVVAMTTTTTTAFVEVVTEVELEELDDDESDAEEDGSYAWIWHSVQTTWQEQADEAPISTRRSSVFAVPMA